MIEEYLIVSDSGISPEAVEALTGQVLGLLVTVLGYLGGMILSIAVMWSMIKMVVRGIQQGVRGRGSAYSLEDGRNDYDFNYEEYEAGDYGPDPDDAIEEVGHQSEGGGI
jgi:hypothetical protein